MRTYSKNLKELREKRHTPNLWLPRSSAGQRADPALQAGARFIWEIFGEDYLVLWLVANACTPSPLKK
jgi:hypothetical protein